MPSYSAIVTVDINPDTPAPRCVQVRGSQRLRIANRTNDFNASGTTISVLFARFAARSIPPGQSTTYDAPLGDFLAVGVHDVHVDFFGGSGPEIWLTSG
jgi:hypothetical protein